MTDSYVAAKMREALIQGKGSRGAAQRLLLAWAASDDRLLRGLAQPFMKAIVTNAVERATRRAASAAAAARAQEGLSPEALDKVLSRLGQAGDATAPAAASAAMPLAFLAAKPAARKQSTNQEKAMRTIAAAFARKRLETP